MNKNTEDCVNCGRFVNKNWWVCDSCDELVSFDDGFVYNIICNVPDYIPRKQIRRYIRNKIRLFKEERKLNERL